MFSVSLATLITVFLDLVSPVSLGIPNDHFERPTLLRERKTAHLNQKFSPSESRILIFGLNGVIVPFEPRNSTPPAPG